MEDIWAQFEQPNAQHINGSGKLHGSRFHDVLNGQNGDDFLYGYRGDDILRGGQGNDVLGGDDGNDVFEGGDGNDVLLAGEGDDILDGGRGDDELHGGSGNDTYRFGAAFGRDEIWADEIWREDSFDRIELTRHKRADVRFSRGSGNEQSHLLIDTADGNQIKILFQVDFFRIDSIQFADGSILQAADFLKPYLINGDAGHSGRDTFVFDTALNSSYVDTVKDFAVGIDKIALGKAIFGGLGNSIEASEFGLGSSAANSSQCILFNQADGKLYYVADGNGSAAAVHFATLQGSGLNQLDHTSFSLI